MSRCSGSGSQAEEALGTLIIPQGWMLRPCLPRKTEEPRVRLVPVCLLMRQVVGTFVADSTNSEIKTVPEFAEHTAEYEHVENKGTACLVPMLYPLPRNRSSSIWK